MSQSQANNNIRVGAKRKRQDDKDSAIDLAPCIQPACPKPHVGCIKPAKCEKTRCQNDGCPIDEQLSCHSQDITPLSTPGLGGAFPFQDTDTGMPGNLDRVSAYLQNTDSFDLPHADLPSPHAAYDPASYFQDDDFLGYTQSQQHLDSSSYDLPQPWQPGRETYDLFSPQEFAPISFDPMQRAPPLPPAPRPRHRQILQSEQYAPISYEPHQPQQLSTRPYQAYSDTSATSDADQMTSDIEQINLYEEGDVTITPESYRSTSEEGKFRCEWLTDKEYDICGKTFDDAETLHMHFRSDHRASAKENQKTHVCYWLGCWAKGKEGVEHEKSGTSSKLDRHVLSHTNFHEHVCSTCGKTTATADQLKKHIRTHTGEQPHACWWKGPNVTKGDAYIEDVHGVNGEQCTKAFKTGSELQTHLDVHKAAQKYECEYCNKRFTDASNLSKHKKTHQEPMFECEACGQRFRRMDHWKRHQDDHNHMPSLYRPRGIYDSEEQKKECEAELDKWKKEVHRRWKVQAEEEKMLPRSEWHSRKRSGVEGSREGTFFGEKEW